MTFIAPFGPVFYPVFGGVEVEAEANWWEAGGATGCLAAYQPKGATSYAASKINLANPGTYDAAEGSAPAWAAGTGWTFSGTKYLKTGVTPLVSYSVIIRFSGYTFSATAALFGTYTTNGFLLQFVSGPKYRYWNGLYNEVSSALGGGVVAISGKNCYLNGVADGTIGAGSLASQNQMYIGALNFSNSPTQYCACTVEAMAIYNTGIDAYQAALYTAMAAI